MIVTGAPARTRPPHRWHRSGAAGFAAVVAGLGLLVVGAAPPGAAAPTSTPQSVAVQGLADAIPVTGGRLDWGVKESFRTYVEGPIADGVIEVHAPATRNPDGTFRFAAESGVVDAAADSASIDFGGEVYFEGHGEGDAALLRMWLTDPRLQINGDSGILVADLRSLSGADIVDYPAVTVAELDLTGQSLDPDPRGTLVLTGISATLTAAGAPAFGGFYEAGEALDPVSVSVTVEAGPTPPPTTPPPTTPPPTTPPPTTSPPTTPPTMSPTAPPTSSAPATPTPTQSTSAPTAPPLPTPSPSATWEEGEISSGLLDWGFKESFLTYIGRGIANGGWTTSGVAEVNGVFRWTAAYGDYDVNAGTGRAAFTGKVRFTGHDGALDLTISRPQVRFDGGTKAVLLLDVLSKSLNDDELIEQQAVEFATLDLGAANAKLNDDSISYAGVPLTLTDAGATGFGGFYEAGTALDPMTVVFGVGGEEVPGGGSAGGPGGGLAGTGGGLGLTVAGGALVLAGAVLVGLSRRRSRAAHAVG